MSALDRGLLPGEGEYVGVRRGKVTRLWRWRGRLAPARCVALLPVTFATRHPPRL